MKRTILRLAVCVLLLFTFSSVVYAADFKIQIDESYTYTQKEDSKKEMASLLGVKESELQKTFEEQNIEYLAVSKDKKVQIRVSVYENKYSAAVGDISRLKGEALNSLGSSVSGENGYTETKINKRSFLNFSSNHNDTGGLYTVNHYITVAKGKFYQLSFYTPTDYENDISDGVLKSFEIPSPKNNLEVWQIILLVLGITVFTAVAVVTVISIIKDKKE